MVRVLHLGTDLSSDICELTHDDHFIYACIRNGPITVVAKRDFSIVGSYGLSGSTVKSIQAVGDYLVCSNVEGHLLIIEKAKMELRHSVALHRQNLRSLIVEGEDIYTAGQDKLLFRTKLPTLVSELLKRNVHRKMFDLISLYRQHVVTASYPCGEIRFINKDYPDQEHVLPIIPSLTGTVIILDDTLYLANRAIDGITAIHLDRELSLQA